MTPLLSVAIPTHNRARYAIHAIRSILAVSDERIELVVSDTSTNNELCDQLNELNNRSGGDTRLKYIQPVEKLDMTGNHNNALAATTGEYVCLIGDDDSITAEAVSAAAWAAKNNIEIIAPNVVANYAWPDFRSRFFGKGHSSRLYISKEMGGVTMHDSASAVVQALNNAGQGADGLPKIYHGIVKRSLLQVLKDESGSYFHGSSPDVSGAIGLALCSKGFLVTDYPLTIPGASGGSNTGRSAMNTHKGRLDEESQTKGFEVSGWSLGVPRFFSVETVWAHAALETISKLAPSNIRKFNFAKLLGVCKALHPEYSREINQATVEAVTLTGIDLGDLVTASNDEMKSFKRGRVLRTLKRLMRPTAAGGRTYIPNLMTIAAASDALKEHMQSRNVRWEQIEATFCGK